MNCRSRPVLTVAVLLWLCQLTLSVPEQARAQLELQDLVSIAKQPDPPIRSDNELRRIDPMTGETISSGPIRIPEPGECDLLGGNGLATNPLTEELFALLSCRGKNRLLAVIDAFTGEAEIVGDTGDKFAALAFRFDGTLFGATGSVPSGNPGRGAKNPNILYTLNTTDASATPVCRLSPNPPGEGGQTLAFTPAGVLFRATGFRDPNRRLESVENLEPKDPITNCDATVKPISGDDYDEATALVYEGAGSFLFAELNDLNSQNQGRLFRMTTEGEATRIGLMDHRAKGLAFIPGPAEVCYSVSRDRGRRANQRDIALEDLIVGPRSARIRTAKAFLVCVPGNVRFIDEAKRPNRWYSPGWSSPGLLSPEGGTR